jgi:hypothetical protein
MLQAAHQQVQLYRQHLLENEQRSTISSQRFQDEQTHVAKLLREVESLNHKCMMEISRCIQQDDKYQKLVKLGEFISGILEECQHTFLSLLTPEEHEDLCLNAEEFPELSPPCESQVLNPSVETSEVVLEEETSTNFFSVPNLLDVENSSSQIPMSTLLEDHSIYPVATSVSRVRAEVERNAASFACETRSEVETDVLSTNEVVSQSISENTQNHGSEPTLETHRTDNSVNRSSENTRDPTLQYQRQAARQTGKKRGSYNSHKRTIAKRKPWPEKYQNAVLELAGTPIEERSINTVATAHKCDWHLLKERLVEWEETILVDPARTINSMICKKRGKPFVYFDEKEVQSVELYVRTLDSLGHSVSKKAVYEAFDKIWLDKSQQAGHRSVKKPSRSTLEKAFASLPSDIKEITVRVSPGDRSSAATPERLSKFYDLLDKILDEYDLRSKPHRM